MTSIHVLDLFDYGETLLRSRTSRTGSSVRRVRASIRAPRPKRSASSTPRSRMPMRMSTMTGRAAISSHAGGDFDDEGPAFPRGDRGPESRPFRVVGVVGRRDERIQERLSTMFEVLLNPGDTFNTGYIHSCRRWEHPENTRVAPSPVPLPAGAPLLLAALGGLASRGAGEIRRVNTFSLRYQRVADPPTLDGPATPRLH